MASHEPESPRAPTVSDIWRWNKAIRAESDTPAIAASRSTQPAEPSRASRAVLTVAELATMLGLHPETVRQMARRREIPSIKFGGRTSPYRFRPAAIEAWLAAREKGGYSR